MGESNSSVQRPTTSGPAASGTVANSKARIPRKRVFTRPPVKGDLYCGARRSLRLQHAIHFQPEHELREPAGAGLARIAEAEAIATVLVEMELHGTARVLPGGDQPEVALAEQWIVRGQRHEHR